MALDHSDFIKKYQAPARKKEPIYKPPMLKWWAVAVALLSYIGFYLAVALRLEMDGDSLLILTLVVVGGFCATWGIAYFLRVASPQERERLLLLEVLEASRGARMITNAAGVAELWNEKFVELTGGKPEGFNSLLKLFAEHTEAKAHFSALAEEARKGLSDEIELKLSNPKGYDQWLVVTAQPIPGWAGYVHWRIDDVTREREQSRIISEEREKLIDFTDNAPVGFFSVDEEGRFVFANATLARWLGEDILAMLKNGRLHTYLAETENITAPYDIKEGGGVRQVAEVKMKGGGGKTFMAAINMAVVNEADGHVRTRGVVNDLTAERAMRQALQASEDRFRRFFEEAPLGIALISAEERIVDVNAALAAMMSMKLDTMSGMLFKDMIDMADWDTASEAVQKVRSGDSLTSPVEVRLWTGDKKPLTVRMIAQKFGFGEEVVLHLIDQTQLKTLETQFIQSQKMQAVGQLAGGIAHDFNNLLTAIIGFCDLLMLRHKPGDASFGDIQQIKQNSNRAANLVRQLLAFSRQQTLRPKVQDITDILIDLGHLLRRLIGANIELTLNHGHDLGYVKVDGGQMEQVLVNMAVNARDAMADGGSLKISTSAFDNDVPQKCGEDLMPSGAWVRIDVADTGSGMPKEVQDRIFEPFFTTKDVGQGTGLGLATVYGIVRQTGGYLDVKSEVGVGTIFSIYLPRLADDALQAEAPAAIEQEVVKDLTGTARILLVEDEDAVRTFSTRALSNKGYEVIGADCGEAGLDAFKSQTKPIDLLITDVIMPGMDGPTLANHIRQQNPNLKIIFISGYTEDKLKDHMGEGIYFLPKPFSLKELAAKVKDVLG